jgi:hypothetical protein
MKTQKATQRLIDAVWTLEFRQVEKDKVEIVRYSRNDPEGYEREHQLPRMKKNEDEARNIVSVEIKGKTYQVTNPQYVFSYGANE